MVKVMKVEDYLYEVDCKLSKKLDADLTSLKYSNEEARVASVLTRVDVGLGVAAIAYNSKILRSINLGVWGIFIIVCVDLVLKLI